MCYRYSPSQPIFNIKSHCDIIKNHTENKISVDDDERSGLPWVSENSDFNRYFTSKIWFYHATIATMNVTIATIFMPYLGCNTDQYDI